MQARSIWGDSRSGGLCVLIWGMALAAGAELRSDRGRFAWSVLLTMTGIVLITLVLVVAGLVQHSERAAFERTVGRPATLMITGPDGGQLSHDTVQRMRTDFDRYRITASPLLESTGVSYRRGERQTGPLPTTGADAGLYRIRRLSLLTGRWLTEQDGRRMEPALVVDRGFAARLGLTPANAVGSMVEVGAPQRWVTGRVVGVLDDDRGDVYLPYAAMVRWQLGEGADGYLARVGTRYGDRVISALRRDSVTSWGLPAHARIRRADGAASQVGATLRPASMAVAGGLALPLLLPVLGSASAAVRRRRPRLAVQRGYGATTSDLFLIVLLESLLIAMAGALLGIALIFTMDGPLLALLADHGPFSHLELATAFPWQAALLAGGLAICSGLITGLPAAIRAARRAHVPIDSTDHG